MIERSPWHVWRISWYYKFAVCLTPRCGSTSVSAWFNSIHPPSEQTSLMDGEWLNDEQRRVMCQRFTTLGLIRDPWSRMVSAYLGKIVAHQRLENAQRLIEVAQQIRGEPVDLARGITFRQFIYLTRIFTDDHWRPLVEYMPTKPALLATPATLVDMIANLTRRVQCPEIPCPRENTNTYGPPMDDAADMPPAELRAMPAFPRWDSFYDFDLKAEIGKRYAEDCERFGLKWEIPT